MQDDRALPLMTSRDGPPKNDKSVINLFTLPLIISSVEQKSILKNVFVHSDSCLDSKDTTFVKISSFGYHRTPPLDDVIRTVSPKNYIP